MFKWILILTLGLLGYEVISWSMGNKPQVLKKQPSPAIEYREEVPARSTPTPTPSQVAQADMPPTDIVVLGWYTVGLGLQVRFPDGYGFLREGDFFHDWRIKKLLTKGCILVDMSGHEYLVRLRLNYPDPQEEMQREVPELPNPVVSR
jgi:hypothetical protein